MIPVISIYGRIQRLIALECSHHIVPYSTFPFTRVTNANFVWLPRLAFILLTDLFCLRKIIASSTLLFHWLYSHCHSGDDQMLCFAKKTTHLLSSVSCSHLQKCWQGGMGHCTACNNVSPGDLHLLPTQKLLHWRLEVCTSQEATKTMGNIWALAYGDQDQNRRCLFEARDLDAASSEVSKLYLCFGLC